MYIPKYFKLQEFFPSDFYSMCFSTLGEALWQLIDDRILKTADMLRERYGPVIVNDWLWRTDVNKNQFRGFRTSYCKVGANLSMHRFGRALDCKFVSASVNDVRNEIISNDIYAFKHITCVESEVSWLHLDCRNHDKKRFGVKIIKP